MYEVSSAASGDGRASGTLLPAHLLAPKRHHHWHPRAPADPVLPRQTRSSQGFLWSPTVAVRSPTRPKISVADTAGGHDEGSAMQGGAPRDGRWRGPGSLSAWQLFSPLPGSSPGPERGCQLPIPPLGSWERKQGRWRVRGGGGGEQGEQVHMAWPPILDSCSTEAEDNHLAVPELLFIMASNSASNPLHYLTP